MSNVFNHLSFLSMHYLYESYKSCLFQALYSWLRINYKLCIIYSNNIFIQEYILLSIVAAYYVYKDWLYKKKYANISDISCNENSWQNLNYIFSENYVTKYCRDVANWSDLTLYGTLKV